MITRGTQSAQILITIVIEDSVTSIGITAFFGCSNLKEIYIPDGVDTTSVNISVPVTTTQYNYKLEVDNVTATIV